MQAKHGVGEDDEATDNVQCQADSIEFCSKDARIVW